MKWSWKIGRLAGIDILMHWTFLLLLAWLLITFLVTGQTLFAALRGIAFVLAIFACVILHEFGHALTARRYGIQTRDVTLLPIGGLARLERLPDNPYQELWVALAGPAVNVVIASLLFLVTLVTGAAWDMPRTFFSGSFITNLMWVNVILVVFNLLPAFPMDGGRVLRALLATSMEYTRATGIAATVGQSMAILFGFVGLFFNPLLLFIALFVYLGADAEARMVQMKALLEGIPAREAMITRFRTLAPTDSLQVAADELLAGAQQDFPIVDGGEFRGMLRREDIVRGLREETGHTPVSTVMVTECSHVDEREMLDHVMRRMQEGQCSTLPVLRDGQLIGLITLANVGELMMIRSALRREPLSADAENLLDTAYSK